LKRASRFLPVRARKAHMGLGPGSAGMGRAVVLVQQGLYCRPAHRHPTPFSFLLNQIEGTLLQYLEFGNFHRNEINFIGRRTTRATPQVRKDFLWILDRKLSI
jgi:hypothetical protein